MPRAKARYVGSLHGYRLPDLSKNARAELSQFCREEDFPGAMQACADFAIAELCALKARVSRQDLGQELTDVLRAVEVTAGKLEMISPQLDVLIDETPPEEPRDRLRWRAVDPRDTAAELHRLSLALKAAQAKLEATMKLPLIKSMQRRVALELAHRVAQCLIDFGIVNAKRVSDLHGEAHSVNGPIVKSLRIMGDDIGLTYDPRTWRTIVAAAAHRAFKIEAARKALASASPRNTGGCCAATHRRNPTRFVHG
jgi:hypothetical protein